MNIQHRAVNDAAGNANHGSLLKISGFKVRGKDDDDDWHGKIEQSMTAVAAEVWA